MTTRIYTDVIFDRCRVLTSFEGREQKDAQGMSLYERIHLQERDRTLIAGYAKEAAADLSKYIAPFCAVTIGDAEVRIDWLDSYTIPAQVPALIEQYVTNHAMSAWMLDKVAERAKYYADEATRLAAGIPSIIFRTLP